MQKEFLLMVHRRGSNPRKNECKTTSNDAPTQCHVFEN